MSKANITHKYTCTYGADAYLPTDSLARLVRAGGFYLVSFRDSRPLPSPTRPLHKVTYTVLYSAMEYASLGNQKGRSWRQEEVLTKPMARLYAACCIDLSAALLAP